MERACSDQAALSPFAGPRFQDAQGRSLRGVMPSGLIMHAGRLYVAESGINAVAVIDATTMDVIAHIPVGWNPSAVAFSPDGTTLYVVNTKGKGAGPNGGSKHDPNAPTYVGSLEYGQPERDPAGHPAGARCAHPDRDRRRTRRPLPASLHCRI